MLNQQQYQKLQSMGLSSSQVNQVVNAAGGIQQEQPKGVGGWLTGGKKGLGGIATAAGNILNLPSYAIGGLLNRGQQAFGSKYAQGQEQGLGILEGIKNKRGVFSEAPETLGIDPNTKAGKVIGFGAELLTPNLPIGKLTRAFKGGNAISDLSKTSKLKNLGKGVSTVKDDAARKLLEKSYKLNKTNINKIAEAIGVTDEAQKSIKVIDYLEGLGLKGANRESLDILNKRISSIQKPFNKLTKTGGQVSRIPYITNILNEAIRQEALNTPASLALSKRLFEEALRQEKLSGGVLTDTDLTKTITQLWSDVRDSAISDPKAQSLAKSLAKSGSNARELLRPGSQKMGRKLRGLITAQEQLGSQANTGLGSQLISAFKPAGIGFGVGATYGAVSGENPLVTGFKGAVGASVIGNPKVMNLAGKTLQKGLPKIENKVVKTIGKVGFDAFKRVPSRTLRVYAQPKTNRQEARTINQPKSQVKMESYKPTISPVTPKIKSTIPTAEQFYEELRKKRGY